MSSSNHPHTPFITARFVDEISVVAYSPLIAARSTSGSNPSPSAWIISSGSLTAPSGPDSRTRYASRASGPSMAAPHSSMFSSP